MIWQSGKSLKNEKMSLKNKIIIVTGGTQGIGRQISLDMSGAGATVYAIYHTNDTQAQTLISEANQQNLYTVKCPVTDFDALKNTIKDIKQKNGRIDILINNAGVFYNKLLPFLKSTEIGNLIDTNVKGVMYASSIVSKYMISQREGILINMASIAAYTNFRGNTVYGASKAAIVAFSKNLAEELLPFNIKVFCIAPGLVRTNMIKQIQTKEIEQYKQSRPIIEASEVSELVQKLCKHSSGYTTGKTYKIGF